MSAPEKGRKRPQSRPDTLRTWLAAQPQEYLVDLLWQHAQDDAELRDSIELQAAAQRVGGLDLAPFASALDRAILVAGYVEEDEVPTYAHRIDGVLAQIRGLLAEGHARAVVELAEHAQRRMQEAIESVGDDGGYVDALLDDIQALHLAACRRTRLDPEDLASRLLGLETGSEYGFSGAASTYANLLGTKGLAAYRRLAEAQWAKQRALRPGENPPYDPRRAALTTIMTALAERSGNLDEQVAVRRRDLSSPAQFLAIARLYRDGGRGDDALDWAEQGLAAFPGERVGRDLVALVVDAYQDRGRHDEAMALAWEEFRASPSLRSYQALKARADRAGEWEARREPARTALRQGAGAARPARGGGWGATAGRSALVQALLWEGDPDQAWREAVEGGCSDDTWLELAAAREAQHPEDAIATYQRVIERLVQEKDKPAYQQAASLAARVRSLQAGIGQEAQFAAYLERLRAAHRPKRNFMAALDQAGL